MEVTSQSLQHSLLEEDSGQKGAWFKVRKDDQELEEISTAINEYVGAVHSILSPLQDESESGVRMPT